jgi:hypothetical protein
MFGSQLRDEERWKRHSRQGMVIILIISLHIEESGVYELSYKSKVQTRSVARRFACTAHPRSKKKNRLSERHPVNKITPSMQRAEKL